MIEVILPVLDEAEALPLVLGAFPSGYEPLVVDNGSTDGSADVARRLGAQVVSEPTRGFGSACYAGLVAARSDLVCFMDADGSLDPGELSEVTDPVSSGALGLCLGARQAERGAWPIHARLANRVIASELRRRTGAVLSDLGPMRCAPREALIALDLRDRAFAWPLEMVLSAGTAGWQIGEAPITYRQRATGRSKVTGSARGTYRAIRDMSRVLSA
ncbi:MAG TPA: glycosyltransferase family 2 protein [Solirubrobacteraceae bacterium]|nr:glycosyltransferase family 2 protein [Solirubrobacteraceae bacterium]